MRQPEVLEAKSGDKKKVLSTACLAFSADPFMRWIMPEGRSYLDKYRELIEIYCCEKSLQYSSRKTINLRLLDRILNHDHFSSGVRDFTALVEFIASVIVAARDPGCEMFFH